MPDTDLERGPMEQFVLDKEVFLDPPNMIDPRLHGITDLTDLISFARKQDAALAQARAERDAALRRERNLREALAASNTIIAKLERALAKEVHDADV